MNSFIKKWFPTCADYPESRLFSLDMLRGLDMLLLTVIGPLLRYSQEAWHWLPVSVMKQLTHPWGGFTLWDIIMPLFIFMCGAAMPFALSKRLKEGQATFWKHVLWRVVYLWILGGLVQGDWAKLDFAQFRLFSNTLQSIACGYLVTAALMSLFKSRFRRSVPIFCALGLTLAYALMFIPGGYAKDANIASRFDTALLSLIFPEGHKVFTFGGYTWWATIPMFAAMTLFGYGATEILIGEGGKKAKFWRLFAYGAAMEVAGWILESWIPCIKHFYSASFTLQAMGWCSLALAMLYLVNDILMLRRGTALVLLFGQFALTSYFVSHFFRNLLTAFGQTVMQGVVIKVSPAVGAFWVQAAGLVGLVALMCVWRKVKR